MLKKNLVRTGFISHAMLLLIPVTTNISVKPGYIIEEQETLLENILVFNDTLTVKADSVALMPPPPPVKLNRNAEKFVANFIKRENEFLELMKRKSPNYFRTINAVFNKYGIPEELRYLAVIESQLKTTAVSRVGAKGMWQFMPVTARELGLKVNGKTDERTHFYKSTVAAAKYLKWLHKEFNGDWLLVLAAYNGGPGTVYKAIKKAGSRNFWVLQKYLPEESRGHVKRFIGVHYYFEGTGSIVTLTRNEAIAYQKQLAEYEQQLEEFENANRLPAMEKDTVSLVAVTHQE